MEGNTEGEAVRRSGALLGLLRWDSGWQGGRGSRKRKRRRKTDTGEADRDMAACDSHRTWKKRVRQR